MLKAILAGTTALAIAGSTLVYAQQQRPSGPGDSTERSDRSDHGRMSRDDMAAFADARVAARIAALRTGLKLTPDQEKNWPAYENAIRDLVKLRRDRMEAFRNQEQPTDPVERLRRRADALTNAGAALKRLADAEDPLYKSLDEAQKRRFAALSRPMAARMEGGMMGRGMEERGRRWREDRHEERHGDRGREFRGDDRAERWRGRDEWRRDREDRGQRQEWRGRDRDRNSPAERMDLEEDL